MTASPPPTSTSLLSLPNEVLVKIARVVAPDGGRKAGKLRLVCRHLGRVVAPVTWASIRLLDDADALDELAAELLNNHTGHTSLIKSLRYNKPVKQLRVVVSAIRALPSLRRLHLAALSGQGLFVPEHDLLRSWPSLEVQQLDHVDLQSMWDISSWAPNLSSLIFGGCRETANLFRNPIGKVRFNSIQSLEITRSGKPSAGVSNTVDQLLLTVWACHRARSVNIIFQGDVLTPWADQRLDNTNTFNGRTEPFSLKLVGTMKLFKATSPTDPIPPLIIRILHWVALLPLTNLTLTSHGDTFFANDALASLSLPRVHALAIHTTNFGGADLLSWTDLSNYDQLVRFLAIASLPSLSILHLRGWLDLTGVSKIAHFPVEDLATQAPIIYVLLGVLRRTAVAELRLENSQGHAEGSVQCIFSRDEGGDCTSRLTRFW